jgi:putative oxidoreductase
MKTMNFSKIFSWACRLVAALILFQTLYFKFTAHPESVELFTKLGVEPWGRIGTGTIELITGILLLIPATAFIGGFLATGLMFGAIASHLLVIGIESGGDGGELFIFAIIVLVLSLIIQYLHRREGFELATKYLPKSIAGVFVRLLA